MRALLASTAVATFVAFGAVAAPLSLDARPVLNQDEGKYGSLVDEGKFGANADEGKYGRNTDEGKYGANLDEGKYGQQLGR